MIFLIYDILVYSTNYDLGQVLPKFVSLTQGKRKIQRKFCMFINLEIFSLEILPASIVVLISKVLK